MEHTLPKSCHPHAFAHFDVGRSMFDVGCSQKREPGKNVAADRKEPNEATTVFLCADAVHLPLPDKTCRVVIARLLLPYTPINDTLRELIRVLAKDGLLYLQVHGPRYYLEGARRRWRSPLVAAYYLRPLSACAWLRLTGHQPTATWFRETALTYGMLQRLMEPYGFTEQWRGSDRVRPFAVYRRRTED